MPDKEKAVVIYSGGMDSFTLLHHAIREDGVDVHALSFFYGQRHKRELDCAHLVCERLGVPHTVVDISTIQSLLGGSALTDDVDVPEGHYTEPSMKLTVVPNRNMILLSIAAGFAVSVGARAVYYGAHAGDHPIYPDCREEFVQAASLAMKLGNYDGPVVRAPFLHMDKGDILIHGIRDLGLVPTDYANTWTCYKGGDVPCGKCGACVERAEAFEKAKASDPLLVKETTT